MNTPNPELEKLVTRSARRNQLQAHAGDIAPLVDPESIPLDKFMESTKEAGNPFMGLADYLASYMSEWTTEHLGSIGVEMVEDQAEHYRNSAYQNYFPGFAFMAYLFDSIPSVCADAGVNNKDSWINTALASKALGERTAVQSTRVQATLVSLLIDRERFAETLANTSPQGAILQESFDPRRLKLKNGIITFADDEAKTIDYVLDVVRSLESGEAPANCIALQVKTGDDKTIFDDFWNLYCYSANKLYENPRPATGLKKLHRTNLEMKRLVLDFLGHDLYKLQVDGGVPDYIAEQVVDIFLAPHTEELFREFGKRSGNPYARSLARRL